MTKKEYQVRDTINQKVYRAESGLVIKGKTAYDIVKFEMEELGNDDILIQAINNFKIQDLMAIPEKDVVWVCLTKEDANRYYESGAEEYPLGKDNVILAKDDEGGYLVIKNASKYISKNDKVEFLFKEDGTEFSLEDLINILQSALKENNKKQVKMYSDAEGNDVHDIHGIEVSENSDTVILVPKHN